MTEKWISVKERLPGKEAILFFDGNCEVVCIGWYEVKYNRWIEERRFGENVTHWMPLPENPQKDEK